MFAARQFQWQVEIRLKSREPLPVGSRVAVLARLRCLVSRILNFVPDLHRRRRGEVLRERRGRTRACPPLEIGRHGILALVDFDKDNLLRRLRLPHGLDRDDAGTRAVSFSSTGTFSLQNPSAISGFNVIVATTFTLDMLTPVWLGIRRRTSGSLKPPDSDRASMRTALGA